MNDTTTQNTNEEAFLPEDYQVPKAESKYVNAFPIGEFTFRVLEKPVTGYVYWNTSNKPVRSPVAFTETPDLKLNKQGKKQVDHFWAMPIWNITEGKLQILEIKTKTVMTNIQSLYSDKDWGNPKGYNITVEKTKTGTKDTDVKYEVRPKPHSPVPAEAVEAYSTAGINMQKLFIGEDVFPSDDENVADVAKEIEKAI